MNGARQAGRIRPIPGRRIARSSTPNLRALSTAHLRSVDRRTDAHARRLLAEALDPIMDPNRGSRQRRLERLESRGVHDRRAERCEHWPKALVANVRRKSGYPIEGHRHVLDARREESALRGFGESGTHRLDWGRLGHSPRLPRGRGAPFEMSEATMGRGNPIAAALRFVVSEPKPRPGRGHLPEGCRT